MKTIKFLVLALCLSAAPVLASGDEKPLSIESQQKLVMQQLSSSFQFPKALIGRMNESSVLIEFEVLENHQLKIKSMDCQDAFTRLHLRKELEKTKIYLPQEQSQAEYKVKLVF